MKCSDANKMNIAEFLMSKGIDPDKTTEKIFWYCSPLRNERTPSFNVDRVKNLWYDFGTATGGTLIDLVCQMYKVDIPGALQILSGVTYPTNFPIIDRQVYNRKEPGIEIINIQPIKTNALYHYLISRKINPLFASKYCVEATYKIGTKERNYFSIGFKNDSGGYELRNRYVKLSTSPKDITIIKGQNRFAVNIFEGFMDFFSALTYFKTDRAGCDTIVLNGVGFVKKILDQLPRYSSINLFLDNDNAGSEGTTLIQHFRNDAVNRSHTIYPNYKDFNDFICSKNPYE